MLHLKTFNNIVKMAVFAAFAMMVVGHDPAVAAALCTHWVVSGIFLAATMGLILTRVMISSYYESPEGAGFAGVLTNLALLFGVAVLWLAFVPLQLAHDPSPLFLLVFFGRLVVALVASMVLSPFLMSRNFAVWHRRVTGHYRKKLREACAALPPQRQYHYRLEAANPRLSVGAVKRLYIRALAESARARS